MCRPQTRPQVTHTTSTWMHPGGDPGAGTNKRGEVLTITEDGAPGHGRRVLPGFFLLFSLYIMLYFYSGRIRAVTCRNATSGRRRHDRLCVQARPLAPGGTACFPCYEAWPECWSPVLAGQRFSSRIALPFELGEPSVPAPCRLSSVLIYI